MIHPSYTELIDVINSESDRDEAPLVNSRYSVVLATSRRARQIIAGDKPLVEAEGKKPLSIAVEELYQGKVRILPEDAGSEHSEVPADTVAQTEEVFASDGREEAEES